MHFQVFRDVGFFSFVPHSFRKDVSGNDDKRPRIIAAWGSVISNSKRIRFEDDAIVVLRVKVGRSLYQHASLSGRRHGAESKFGTSRTAARGRGNGLYPLGSLAEIQSLESPLA